MTEQNWRDLPAGRELDRLVAEKAGYRVQHDHPDYILWSADGDFVVRQPDEYLAWRHVPHYSTSVDAALTLPLNPGEYGWALKIVPDFSGGLVWAMIIDDAGQTVSRCIQPARLIALAMVQTWLAWKEANGHAG